MPSIFHSVWPHSDSSSYNGDSVNSNSRFSVDQSSIRSAASSMTRGSDPSFHHDSIRPSFSSDRHAAATNLSHRPAQNPHHHHHHIHHNHPPPAAPVHSVPQSGASPDADLTRPKDDKVVDKLFYELMVKRGWQNLPEQAKRQMLAYPASKKWTLVHQDRLTQRQGDQKRKEHMKHAYGGDGQSGLLHRAEDEGSPEWYVKKVLDNSITQKQLLSLSVNLRTQQIK